MIKRLFFGLEALAPWPESFPKGRILPEASRHMTLAFLGNLPYPPFSLEKIPLPSFSLGFAGEFDRSLLLPPQHPNVVSWHIKWLDRSSELILTYQRELSDWLEQQKIKVDRRPFLPHVTLARSPFEQESWHNNFQPLPCILGSLHLYESKGNLLYEPLWSYPLLLPFEEIEHTADIAFHIHGMTLEQIDLHAHLALSFRFPPFLSYYHHVESIENLENIILRLNQAILKADSEIGSPFKAVSYHGNVEKKNGNFTWEMIVDV